MTKKNAAKKATVPAVDLTALTPEELSDLRDRLDDLTADQAEASAPVKRTYVYTNVRNADVLIPDLGRKRGRTFDPFVFRSHAVEDLRKRFSPKEIRRSYHLRALVDAGLVVEGEATAEQLKRDEDPIAARVRDVSAQLRDIQASGGDLPAVVQIDDPMAGKRDADRRLKDVMRDGPGGEREDLTTRKR